MSQQYSLSLNSLRHLKTVKGELACVVERALQLSPIDFGVSEGRRSKERQRELYEAGYSQTLRSKHLTGDAVDLFPWVGESIPWSEWHYFELVANAMKEAARELDVDIQWGGDWSSFKDGPHFELTK